MLIIIKGKNGNTGRYKTKDLTPVQRVESLAMRNYKPTGNREVDAQTEANIDTALKEAKQ